MIDKSKIYKNYFATHYSNGVDIEIYYSDTYRYTKKSIGDLFNIYPKDVQILDLGCGFGGFANFCKKEGFGNYTGVDLSTDELEICKNNFKEYTFTQDDIINFLEHTTKKFEIIYLSMVFEHLTLEQCQKLINAVYKVLKKGGVFINYQPNADSYFNSTASLYVDITHERLRGKGSYLQFVNNLYLKNIDISFRNSYIGKNIFQNIIHKTTKKVFEIFLLLLGYDNKEIYTKSFYSIITKL